MFVYSQKVHAFHFTVMKQLKWIHYRPQRSWGKVIFSEACVNNSVQGGHAWLPGGGMHGFIRGVRGFIRGACVVLFSGGHAWFYSAGGHAWFYLGGACVVLFSGGHAWFYSAGGMHGFIQGTCVVLFRGGVHGFFSFSRYNEIRSMSGRYASYWNAFLFKAKKNLCVQHKDF